MAKKLISDLMVPLSEYVRVRENATLVDAIQALEEARVKFRKQNEHHHSVQCHFFRASIMAQTIQTGVQSRKEKKATKI